MTEQDIHRLGAQTQPLPPQLEQLLSYWLQKCGRRRMPSRNDLPVRELRPWLGYLALIEIVGENDFLVRLCGTHLIRRFGREATGAAVADLALDIDKRLTAILKATVKAMAPIVAMSQIPLGRTVAIYREVALPLSGADGTISIVLLGSYPVRES